MKVILKIVIVILLINCKGQRITDYVDISNVEINRNNLCDKIGFSVNGNKINGKFKTKYGKMVQKYARYKDGFYIGNVYTYDNGRIWTKESFGNNGEKLSFTFYGNKKARKIDDFYKIQKYDSLKTVFKNNYPTETLFYNNGNLKRIQYTFYPQKLEIISDIENFKLFNSNVIGFSIPMDFFFNKCPENILTFNPSSANFYQNINIKTRYKDSIKEQNFSLSESLDHMEYLEEKVY